MQSNYIYGTCGNAVSSQGPVSWTITADGAGGITVQDADGCLYNLAVNGSVASGTNVPGCAGTTIAGVTGTPTYSTFTVSLTSGTLSFSGSGTILSTAGAQTCDFQQSATFTGGCAGGSPGNACQGLAAGGGNTLTGSLAFTPTWAGSAYGLLDGGTIDPTHLLIMLTDQDLSTYCAIPDGGVYSSPSGSFHMVSIDLSTTCLAVQPGCCPAAASQGGQVGSVSLVDLTNGFPSTAYFSNQLAGGVYLATLGDAGATGSFGVLVTSQISYPPVDAGSSLSGTFDAPSCPGIAYF